LKTEVHLQTYFEADKRVKQAEADLVEVQAQHEKSTSVDESAEVALRCAEVWVQRVREWRHNLRKDLESDAVPSPSGAETMWLLYMPLASEQKSPYTIRCQLCKQCLHGLQQRGSKKEPEPQLSRCARPRGLWGGPEPAAIKNLTYIERLVLNLARVYFTLKRVLVKDAIWAKSDHEALPQYTTNNVVAYPQDPDAAIKALCVVPADLYKVLTVQFVGSDPSIIAQDPAMIVHLHHLRQALQWFV